MTMPTLGLLEAFDRHGTLLARAPITRWPVTVGRSLDCDLVLDDPFIAPAHLRIDRPAQAPHTVQVEVLHTRNGARLQRKHHASGARFDWPGGVPIDLGHTHVALRLADAPIADEQVLPRFPWRTVATTALLMALVAAIALLSAWLEARDSSQYFKALPGVLLSLLAIIGVWSGAWAAANKVFGRQLQFWRHVRIACTAALAVDAVHLVAHFMAFALSLEPLARFANVFLVMVLAVALWAHLAAVLPRPHGPGLDGGGHRCRRPACVAGRAMAEQHAPVEPAVHEQPVPARAARGASRACRSVPAGHGVASRQAGPPAAGRRPKRR